MARTWTAIDALAARSVAAGSLDPHALVLIDRPAGGQIAVQGIVGRGLIGDEIGTRPLVAGRHPARDLGKYLGGVAEQADGNRARRDARIGDDGQRLVEVARGAVEIAGLQPLLDAARLAFDGEERRARHSRGERLRAAHAAEPGGQDPAAAQVAAVMLASGLGEGLVGALNDALAADIVPRPRGHLAVHHQAASVELVEMIPIRPFAD